MSHKYLPFFNTGLLAVLTVFAGYNAYNGCSKVRESQNIEHRSDDVSDREFYVPRHQRENDTGVVPLPYFPDGDEERGRNRV